MRLGHLSRRFAASLWPAGPSGTAEAWVGSVLTEDEQRLWRRMSRADRRHAIGVAREVEHSLGAEASKPVLAAALLHDVGKVTAGLGTYGRVVATLAGATAGRTMAEAWTQGKGFTRKVGLYLRHPALGADLLALAGSDPLTVTWTREHHLPEEEWTLPPAIAHALKAADDD
jgi:hypothetical protein